LEQFNNIFGNKATLQKALLVHCNDESMDYYKFGFKARLLAMVLAMGKMVKLFNEIC